MGPATCGPWERMDIDAVCPGAASTTQKKHQSSSSPTINIKTGTLISGEGFIRGGAWERERRGKEEERRGKGDREKNPNHAGVMAISNEIHY